MEQIAQAPAGSRQDLIFDHIRRQVIKVLRLDMSQPVDFQRGLTEIGMDSLMAVELRNLLQNDFNRPIPTSAIFEYPTIRELADYFNNEFFSSGNAAESLHHDDGGEEQSHHDKALMQMSEDEAERNLIEELDRHGY
jgi:myxalamid-type polyketide synthase MxaB